MQLSNSSRLVLSATFALWAAGCERDAKSRDAAETPEPAAIGIVRVAEETQQELGLELRPARRREVLSTLTTTGWLEALPGHEVLVKAPVAGFVAAGRSERLPQLGQVVDKDQRLVALQVFLTPQEIAQMVSAKEDVDIAIEQSRATMKLAQEQLDRLSVARDAVAGTRLVELKETYERAKAAWNESRDKLPFLLDEPYQGLAFVKPVSLDAPIAGHVTSVHAAAGQFVIPGDALCTISDWSTLWVRVGVFETDLPQIDRSGAIEVAVPASLQTVQALPVNVLQPTKPGFRSVDLFYEIQNSDVALRVGQAVTVDLPTGRPTEQTLIPRSAVLWDGLGNAWVYVRRDAQTYSRQKVETGRVISDEIVVTRGLAGGEEVVALGAESLYGQEFKGSIQADDD